MSSSFKNTVINDTGFLKVPSGTSNQRPNATVIQWTNTGSQAYSILTGTTPTLTNTSWTAPAGVTQIELLVVAGGGAGGSGEGGGGGGGGLIYNTAYPVTPGTSYTITVGSGGAAGAATNGAVGANGNDSIFGTILAKGGGYGGSVNTPANVGTGGSGGGGGRTSSSNCFGGGCVAGTGNFGGTGWAASSPYPAAGGGGAGAKGGDGNGYYSTVGGNGGIGRAIDITGTLTYYAGGGGAGSASNQSTTAGTGGSGGGGNGSNLGTGSPGTASTGGGGGGAMQGSFAGGAGGSGIVIIRYYTTSTADTAMIRYNTTTSKLEYSDSTWKNAVVTTAGLTLFTQVYNYTGYVQFFNVPVGVTSITVKMWGAAGGGSNAESQTFAGGPGGFSQATVNVSQIPVLHVLVGQGGIQTSTTDTVGTWPGVMTNTNSGKCGRRTNYTSGYGGGRSEIMAPDGTPLVVAGGGGGAAGTGGSSTTPTSGGGGGGLIGANGWYGYNGGGGAGQGGTQSTGGQAGIVNYGGPKSGGFRYGGYAAGFFDADSANYNAMGGGGDGYYGGGAGGAHTGGGGGSGYIHPNYCVGFTIGTVQNGANILTPPMINDSLYNGTAGKSATNGVGQPGYVVIQYYA
jgi:hypothetical protein